MDRRPQALILDLDQTLVDSRCARGLRDLRKWSAVAAMIPRFTIAPGAVELGRLGDLKIAVVTKSPRTYAESVLRHFRIRVDVLVGYHDASPRKPHPAPTRKALQLLTVRPDEAWAAGDHPDDLESARSAGVQTLIGVSAWTDSVAALQAAKPTKTVRHPADILALLGST